jgi:hypothetical protein
LTFSLGNYLPIDQNSAVNAKRRSIEPIEPTSSSVQTAINTKHFVVPSSTMENGSPLSLALARRGVRGIP